MRTTSKFMAVALAAALQPAVAGTVTVNFEDLTRTVLASSYTTASGVSFSGDAWASLSAFSGCGGNVQFSRLVPSGDRECGALLLAAAGNTIGNPTGESKAFFINFAAGFVDFAFNFQAGGLGGNTTISFYSQEGGAGSLLASSALNGNTCLGKDPNSAHLFCDYWDQRSGSNLSGTARSIKITGFDQDLMLDDLTFTTDGSTTGRLPEPTIAALVLGALGALGWSRKRSAAR